MASNLEIITKATRTMLRAFDSVVKVVGECRDRQSAESVFAFIENEVGIKFPASVKAAVLDSKP